jgi:HSP20 family molecular chaperone IbpA
MITAFVDPFEALFNLQRALDARRASDWLQDQTTSEGPFPPINVFQQGGDLLAIIELPGIAKNSLQIEAKENTIRSRQEGGVLPGGRQRPPPRTRRRRVRPHDFPSRPVRAGPDQGGVSRRHPGIVPATVRAR